MNNRSSPGGVLNDNEGNPYTYAVEELEVPQSYVASVEGSVEDGFIVTNTYFEPGKGGGEVTTPPVTPKLAETGVSMYTMIVGGVLLLGIGMQLLPIRRKYDN